MVYLTCFISIYFLLEPVYMDANTSPAQTKSNPLLLYNMIYFEYLKMEFMIDFNPQTWIFKKTKEFC